MEQYTLLVADKSLLDLKPKLVDLQILRAFSIILVLLCHLEPGRFRLGFVGVDIFFVLSGFLMRKILNEKSFLTSTIVEFYKRRFKRIVPLYFLTLLFIYTTGYFFLLAFDKEILVSDLKWGLPFATNVLPLLTKIDYWAQLSEYRLLTHCWSLGVEVQFYVVSVFLFCYPNKWTLHTRLLTYAGLCLWSLYFHLTASENVSYYATLSRAWQFILGALAFELTSEENYSSLRSRFDISRKTEKKTMILVSIFCLVVINPLALSNMGMRVFSTCIASYFVYLSICDQQSILINNKLVLSLGDMSYTMYLVHWPIIVYYKYFLNVKALNATDMLLLSVAVFCVTKVVHELFEKWLVRSSDVTSTVCVVVCISVILVTFPVYSTDFAWISRRNPSLYNMTEKDYSSTIEWNMNSYTFRLPEFPCKADVVEEWTGYPEHNGLRGCKTSGNGTAKVLILGNSISMRAFPLVHQVFNGRYKQLRLYAESACVPVTNYLSSCTDASKKVVERMKPDIIMIIYNLNPIHIKDHLKPIEDEDKDDILLQMHRNLKFYQTHSKVISVDLPYFAAGVGTGYEVAKRMTQGYSLEDLRATRKDDEEQQANHRLRLLKANCTKCIFNPVNEALFDDDYYYFYNRTSLHAVTGDAVHFTVEGLERLRSSYEQTIDSLLKAIQKSHY